MDQLTALTRSRQIILGAALLLFIDTFFAWQKVTFGVSGVAEVSATANAWHGFWGVLMGLLTIAIILWVVARAFGVALPDNVPEGLTSLVLGGVILLCALLKNLTDDYSAWASYVGIVLAALVALGAWMAFQESGEALPQLPMSRPAAATTAGTSAAPSTPPPMESASEAPAGEPAADAGSGAEEPPPASTNPT